MHTDSFLDHGIVNPVLDNRPFCTHRKCERSPTLFGISKDASVKIVKLLLKIDHAGSRYHGLVFCLEHGLASSVRFSFNHLDWESDVQVVHRGIRKKFLL